MTIATREPSSSPPARIAIVVPCYNEEGSIDALLEETIRCLKSDASLSSCDIVLIDDGSKDGTWNAIKSASKRYNQVSALRFSRNFGHQKALLAGLEFSVQFADYIVTMDGDLQHPPAVAKQMLEMGIRDNLDIISAQRSSVAEGSWFKDLSSRAFYQVLNAIGVEITPNASDFRLLSKKAATAMIDHGDVAFFPRGIVSLIGFEQAIIPYQVGKRYAGTSKYTLFKMLKLASEGISALSVAPLRAAFGISVCLLALCMGMAIYIVAVWLQGSAVPGWASIALPLYALFGINFLILGLLGEYIGKAYIQTLGRPRYIVRDSIISKCIKDMP
jgi:glycosyltransferase involved in cell wall biosynthesis